MAIKDMGWDLKNNLLQVAYAEVGKQMYIEARNDLGVVVSDMEEIMFWTSSASGVLNGTVALSHPKSLTIPKAGVSISAAKVYWLYIYKGTSTANAELYSRIALEGNEIKDFSNEEVGGIYQINTLVISM